MKPTRTPVPHEPAPAVSDPAPRPTFLARLRTALGVVALDVAVPFGVYLLAERAGAGPTAALLAGGAVPAVRAASELLLRRRPAPLATLMLVAFALGAMLSLLTGDPRFALAKDAVTPGMLGLVALGSLWVAERPLMFHIRRSLAADGDRWEARWHRYAFFRRAFVVQTVVWSAALLVSAAVGTIAAYVAPLGVAALLCPATSALTVIALIQWSHWYGWRVDRRLYRAEHAGEPGAEGQT